MAHWPLLADWPLAHWPWMAVWPTWMPFQPLEALGFVTGVACVALVVRQSLWNFPVAIVSCLLYFVVFTQAELYFNAGLQLVYVALNAHGLWNWRYGGGTEDRLPVRRLTASLAGPLAVVAVAVAAALTLAGRAVGSASPVLDAGTTAVSLAAQYLLNRKIYESWYVWIAVDAVYIYLNIVNGLYLTAGLYALLLILCLQGLQAWKSEK